MNDPGEWLARVSQLEAKFGPLTDAAMSQLWRRDILETLVAHDNPYGRFFNPAALADGTPEPPYGNRFYGAEKEDGGFGEPKNAGIARRMRDFLVRFGVIAGLQRITEIARSDITRDETFQHLVHRMHRGLAIPVIEPSRLDAQEHPIDEDREPRSNYARSAAAKTFFNGVVQPAIARMDSLYRTHLVLETRGEYDPTDDSSINRWSRVWSAAIAIETLDWFWRAQGAPGNESCLKLAERRWQDLAQGIEYRFNPGRGAALPEKFNDVKPAILPSDNGRMPGGAFALFLRLVLAQTLHYDAARWTQDDIFNRRFRLRFRLQALDQQWAGTRALYRCHSITQLRCALLAECLMIPPSDNENSPSDPSTPPPKTETPEAFSARGLGPVAQRCLTRIDSTRLLSQKTAEGLVVDIDPDTRLVDALNADTTRGTDADGQADTLSLDHARLAFAPASEEAVAFWGRDHVLGAVTLFDELDPDVAWVDISCVIRTVGGEYLIPLGTEAGSPWKRRYLEREDEDSGVIHETPQPADNETEVQHLILPEILPAGVGTRELRDAMGDAQRTFWACENAGLGVIVVVLVVLDQVSTALSDQSVDSVGESLGLTRGSVEVNDREADVSRAPLAQGPTLSPTNDADYQANLGNRPDALGKQPMGTGRVAAIRGRARVPTWAVPTGVGLAAALLLAVAFLQRPSGLQPYPVEPILRGYSADVQFVLDDRSRARAESLSAELRKAGAGVSIYQQGDVYTLDIVVLPENASAITQVLKSQGLEAAQRSVRVRIKPP